MQFTSPTLRGNRFDLRSTRGNPVLVVFWATWCPACREEASAIKRMHERYGKDGLKVVGVSMDNDRQALADFAVEQDMDWPVTFTESAQNAGWNNPIAKHYQVRSIPSVFLLDEHGTIIANNLRGESEIESAILDYFAERP
ncbi:MAG: hypothetical protein CMJ64_19715 [Planctomycetaceae bacterium]|nr:hypothetical protein [Planctomycetaceae bacterium]